MSYKDFVSTVQQGPGFSRNDIPMSPTLGKYLGRSSSDPLPYWSPATRGGGGGGGGAEGRNAGGYGGYTPIEEMEADDPAGGSQNGMNLAAASWEPPSTPHTLESSQREEEEGHNYEQQLGEDFIEPFVEIVWNERTYFVPESSAYAYEEGMGYPQSLEEDTGVEWAYGGASLPLPPKRSLLSIGVPEPIRLHFQQLDTEALRQMDPEDEEAKDVPTRYHSIFVLDQFASVKGAEGSYGYPSTLYKVVDRTDSQIYALRRFETARTSPATVKMSLVKWFDVRHPGVVSLYNIVQERGALFFTHAFYPAAHTLKERFIDQRGAMLKESFIWRMLTQLLSALRVVHSKNLAVRSISTQHVILTSGTVARFNNVGITDILESESRAPLSVLQSEDLMMLGHLILSLATRSTVGQRNVEVAVGVLGEHFTAELLEAVNTLLSGKSSASQVCHLISDKIHDEFDNAMSASDSLHVHLRNEFESGRMVRLLMKLGFVNERQEYKRAPQWSETGDRYVLKLFRDYMFHQAVSDGSPVVDAGHVVSSLNKLDCGDNEQMLLSSRDNKDLLVVSFTDVRRCLESSYLDLDKQADIGQQQLNPTHSAQHQLTQQQQQQQQQQHALSSKAAPTHSQAAKGLSDPYYSTPSYPPTLNVRQQQQQQQYGQTARSSLSSPDPSLPSRSRSNPSGGNGRGRGQPSYPSNGGRSGINQNNTFMSTNVNSNASQSQRGVRSDAQQGQQGRQSQGQSQGLNYPSQAQQQQQQLLLQQQQQLSNQLKLQQHQKQQQQLLLQQQLLVQQHSQQGGGGQNGGQGGHRYSSHTSQIALQLSQQPSSYSHHSSHSSQHTSHSSSLNGLSNHSQLSQLQQRHEQNLQSSLQYSSQLQQQHQQQQYY